MSFLHRYRWIVGILATCVVGCNGSSPAKVTKKEEVKSDGAEVYRPKVAVAETDASPAKSDAPISADVAKSLAPPRPPAADKTPPTSSAKKENGELLKVTDVAGFQAAIGKMKGRVVVVDSWATWCLPCVKNFPKFVELAKKYKGNDRVHFATLSVDDEEKAEEARKILASMGAGELANFLVTDGPIEAPKKLKLKTEGVPVYIIFGVDGALEFDSHEFDKFVAELEKRVK